MRDGVAIINVGWHDDTAGVAMMNGEKNVNVGWHGDTVGVAMMGWVMKIA